MITRISSNQPFEKQAGYCRAVVAGGFVHVAGTVGSGDDVVAQCHSALEIIGNALAEAGSGFEHAVRVVYYLPDREEFAQVMPILAGVFGDNPPAATMLECGLIEEKYRIEIELTALLPNG